MFENHVTACPAKHGEDGSRNDAKTQKDRFVPEWLQFFYRSKQFLRIITATSTVAGFFEF